MKQKPKKKMKLRMSRVIGVAVIFLILIYGIFSSLFKEKNLTVEVVSKIDKYDYYLESNETRIYKKHYKELEKELEDNRIDEKNYVSIISKLFTIDFYTLTNKMTNLDVGGVQFIHTDLKENFKSQATETIYKYIVNNTSGKRKQKLPEVKKVEIENIKVIKYKNKEYNDESSYEVTVKIDYVKDLDYPEKVTLTWIHEENKLSLVEIK